MLVDEMPLISSVYHYRMIIGKELEADPTVLYYMNEEDLAIFKNSPGSKQSGKIFRKYKSMDNPYNTYKNKGLPEGPINSPGKHALIAASLPNKTNYLYFVSNGNGRHIFNSTYKGHLKSK